MSRSSSEGVEQQVSLRLERLADAAVLVWSRFTESRLYVQSVLSLLFLFVACVTLWMPGAYVDPGRSALTWLVTQDYDFAAKGSQVKAWVLEPKGLSHTLSSWSAQGTARLREWLRPLIPRTAPASTLGSGPTLPVNGAVLYGYGWLPEDVRDEFHFGIDLVAPLQTRVVAIDDGMVLRIGSDPRLGQVVEIDHGDVIGLYAQVSAVNAKAGTRVRKGEQIAVVAKASGVEQGEMPHLHFELRPAGRSEQIDPANYLGLGGSKI